MVLLPIPLCSLRLGDWDWCLYWGVLGDSGELYSLSSFPGLLNWSSNSKGLAEQLLLTACDHKDGLWQRAPHTPLALLCKGPPAAPKKTLLVLSVGIQQQKLEQCAL